MRSVITVTLVELMCTPRFDFDLALEAFSFPMFFAGALGLQFAFLMTFVLSDSSSSFIWMCSYGSSEGCDGYP